MNKLRYCVQKYIIVKPHEILLRFFNIRLFNIAPSFLKKLKIHWKQPINRSKVVESSLPITQNQDNLIIPLSSKPPIITTKEPSSLPPVDIPKLIRSLLQDEEIMYAPLFRFYNSEEAANFNLNLL